MAVVPGHWVGEGAGPVQDDAVHPELFDAAVVVKEGHQQGDHPGPKEGRDTGCGKLSNQHCDALISTELSQQRPDGVAA